MGFWIAILGAIIIGVAFSFTSGGNGHVGDGSNGRSGAGNGGSKTPPRRKSDFRENEFDDEIEDFDRFFDNDL